MNFDIYSIGDSAFLEQILNAVAMLSGSGNIGAAAAVGALIGVLVVFVQSAMDGGKGIAFQQILLGWLFYMAMFGPTTTVTIEDSATGHVRIVSNVPIGVAAPGFVISRLGHGITEAFEQAYAPVSGGFTNGGHYGDALKAIVAIRQNAANSRVWSALDAYWGGGSANSQKSLEEYIRDCSLTKYDLGMANTSDLQNAPIMDALQFESEIYYTRLYRSGGPQDVTCSQAYADLSGLINAQFSGGATPAFEAALDAAVDIETGNPAGKTWRSSLAGSINELGMLGANAQSFAIASTVEPILLDAAQGKYDNFQDITLAITLTNAIEQRNISWAASKTMFEETIRPLMTFFEGFIYAITPFIAVLVLMGSFGLKLGFKYFTVIIWIQLWYPLLSIVDLYISMSATREISQALAGGGGGNSIYLMNSAYDAAKTWIGIGSYMASSIPMISFFLVSGSAYAMSGLASGIQNQMAKGADQAASDLQPDALNVGAMSSVMSAGSSNFQTGTQVAGGDQPSFNIGGVAQSQVSSARGGMQEKQDAFSSEMGSTLANATASGTSTQMLSSIGAQTQGSQSETVLAAQEKAEQFQEQYALTDTQTEAITGALTLAANGNISAEAGLGSLSKIGGKLTGQGTATDQSADAFSSALKEAFSDQEGNKLTESEQAQLSNTVTNAVQESDTSSYSDTATATEMEGVKKSASELEKATESYQEASSWSSSLGTNNSMDGKTLAKQVENNDGFGALNAWLADNPESNTAKAFEQRAETLENMSYGNQEQSRQVAALETMLRSGDEEAQQLAQNAISEATGYSLPNPGDANSNAGIGSNVGGVSDADKERANTVAPDEVGDKPAPLDLPTPEEQFEAGKAGALQEYTSNQGNGKAAEAAEAAIEAAAKDPRDHTSAFSIMGLGDQASEILQPAAEGAYEGGSAFIKELGEQIAQGNERAADFFSEMSSKAEEGMGSIYQAVNDSGLFSAEAIQEIGNQAASFVGDAVSGVIDANQQSLSGFVEAAGKGFDAASDYITENSDGMRQEFSELGQSYGLTEDQADVFAAARMHALSEQFWPGGTESSENSLQQSIDHMSEGYSNKELAGNMAEVISGQAENPEFAGGGLAPIAMHNAAAGPDLPRAEPTDFSEMGEDQTEALRDYIRETIEEFRSE